MRTEGDLISCSATCRKRRVVPSPRSPAMATIPPVRAVRSCATTSVRICASSSRSTIGRSTGSGPLGSSFDPRGRAPHAENSFGAGSGCADHSPGTAATDPRCDCEQVPASPGRDVASSDTAHPSHAARGVSRGEARRGISLRNSDRWHRESPPPPGRAEAAGNGCKASPSRGSLLRVVQTKKPLGPVAPRSVDLVKSRSGD